MGDGQASELAARAAGAAEMKPPQPVSLQNPLVAGSQVEPFIDWPAKLSDVTPLQVYVRGTVRWSEGRCTLVAVKSHTFKIKPPLRPMPPGAGALSQARQSAAAV